VDKFIQVTGGKSAYEAIKSEVVKGEISLKDENVTIPIAMYSAEGKSYAYFDVPTMGKFEFGSDGHTSWERSVVLGPRIVPRSVFGNSVLPNARDVLKWTDASLGLETLSKSEVNGKPCYLVAMGGTGTGGTGNTACFDVTTGYLLKAVSGDGTGSNTEESVFSDYRSQNGLITAFHIETKLGGKVVAVQLEEVTLNGPLPEGIFNPPADVRALAQSRESKSKSQATDNPDRPSLRRPPP
jgi:hypothetical protein